MKPKQCEKCICPLGFGGAECDKVAPTYNRQRRCGGTLTAIFCSIFLIFSETNANAFMKKLPKVLIFS